MNPNMASLLWWLLHDSIAVTVCGCTETVRRSGASTYSIHPVHDEIVSFRVPLIEKNSNSRTSNMNFYSSIYREKLPLFLSFF